LRIGHSKHVGAFALLTSLALIMSIASSTAYASNTQTRRWFWLNEGKYAVYESTGPVILFLNLSRRGDVIKLINVVSHIKLSWRILELRGDRAVVRFEAVLYNISKAERWFLKVGVGGMIQERSNTTLPDPYRISKTLILDLRNDSVLYNGKYVGAWSWFLPRDSFFKNTTLHLVKGFYVGIIANPPPMKAYERFTGVTYVYRVAELVKEGGNNPLIKGYVLPKSIKVLNNVELPQSRLGLALEYVDPKPTPIYYDLVTDIVVRIDLWADNQNLFYTDNVLGRVVRINSLWSPSQHVKELPPPPMHVYIVLRDTNIPLGRPVFGATGPMNFSRGLDSGVLILATVVSVLSLALAYLYVRKLRNRL